MPALFSLASKLSVPNLDRALHSAFLSMLGQATAVDRASVLSCYSSSVATEIAGRAMYSKGVRRVGLVHPTFDNIPDILAGVGLELLEVPEESLLDPAAGSWPDLDALFVVSPNNPTGAVLDAEALTRVADWCADRGVVLALDTCFRGFDQRAWFDHYAILEASGTDWFVVEDTGKLYPLLDLKVGLLVFPADSPLPLRRIHTDILLGVSPMISIVVLELTRDAASGGGLIELHRTIAANREILRQTVAGVGYDAWCDPGSRISVQRIRLPGSANAVRVAADLRDAGLHVLPGTKFHWARPGEGASHLRVALGRPADAVRQGAGLLADRLAALASSPEVVRAS
ncbi:pyridoxal phosphate-dependent aminotransferase [Kribbella sp. NPDC050820]|uniref:pyridoxal phosphate-dependent aminotransferase n=1 Tax=Kribbella sp. NPDC050820 TaxID=3155408 RepID=UPI0033D6AE3C